MSFQIWDIECGNCVGAFATRAEAWEGAEELVEILGSEVAKEFMVQELDAGNRLEPIPLLDFLPKPTRTYLVLDPHSTQTRTSSRSEWSEWRVAV